jgi:hypothetical protein
MLAGLIQVSSKCTWVFLSKLVQLDGQTFEPILINAVWRYLEVMERKEP